MQTPPHILLVSYPRGAKNNVQKYNFRKCSLYFKSNKFHLNGDKTPLQKVIFSEIPTVNIVVE